MGGKAKTPEAPDYGVLARQQALEQNKLIDKQTQANRPNQTNPYGSVNWTQDKDGNWTQNVSYDPKVQGNIDAMLSALGQNLSSMKGDFTGPGALQGYKPHEMTTGQFDPMTSWQYGGQNGGTSGDGYADAFTKSLLARVSPQQEVDRGAMENKLRLQGLQPGTPAYDRAMQNLMRSQGDVNSKAALDGMLAASQNARADYATQLSRDQLGLQTAMGNQQMTNATQGQQFDQSMTQHMLPYQKAALMNQMLSGAFTPSFNGFTPAGVGQAADIVGAAQQAYAQQMQSANDKNAKKSGKGQSLGSIAGTVAGGFFGGPAGAAIGSQAGGAAGGAIFSDETLKYDINQMSDSDCFEMMTQLVPVQWRWVGTTLHDAGIIAQRVQELMPDLVTKAMTGELKVNYSELFAILLGAFRHLAKETSHV